MQGLFSAPGGVDIPQQLAVGFFAYYTALLDERIGGGYHILTLQKADGLTFPFSGQ